MNNPSSFLDKREMAATPVSEPTSPPDPGRSGPQERGLTPFLRSRSAELPAVLAWNAGVAESVGTGWAVRGGRLRGACTLPGRHRRRHHGTHDGHGPVRQG